MQPETLEAIQGQRQSWNLIEKLGEGDAGEVYLVDSLLDHRPAILKRPRKSSFFSDILRQANQIKTEGSILRGLQRVTFSGLDFSMHIPVLIDQNKLDAGMGEQVFIVIEKASGVSLKMLSQAIRFGEASLESLSANVETQRLIEQWAQFTEFPAPLLTRILSGVITLLDTIHALEIRNDQGTHTGVIWNDIKPDHLYWDPVNTRLTVIDWGNSQFLGSDGVTKDRQYSAMDDFRQLIQEMGDFISKAAPDLFARLEWPTEVTDTSLYEQAIRSIREKLDAIHQTDGERLEGLRQQEASLYDFTKPEIEQIDQYEQLERQLATFGELPDNGGAMNFMIKAAYQMVSDYRLEEFQRVCKDAARLPSTAPAKWNLLKEIAAVARQNAATPMQATFTNALTAGVAGDWTAALWELFTSLGDGPRPEWWEKISQEVRSGALGLEPDSLPPYIMFMRLYYTLRSEVTRMGEQRLRAPANGKGNHGQESESFHWQASEDLLATLREEIINKWRDIEPSPPYSGIGYSEMDDLIDPVERLLPGWREKLEKSLAQARVQVELVLGAWEQKDFELARRGLRSILLWDPDRARLFTAEKAIGAAPQWLARVRRGAGKDEPFYDYLTSVELAGRTLRNQVGPASWLDETLEALKRLRKGTRSVDLMIEYPQILSELPWLNEYQAREIISVPHTHPIQPERDHPRHAQIHLPTGILEGRFGANQSLTLSEPLDTWIPEARGSSARVFDGMLRLQGKKPLPLAFKIMRPDQLDYALPLFVEEIQILTMLRDVPGVTPMVECGFIKISDGQAFPSDESHASAEQLSGEVIHYGVEQAQTLLASMERQLSAGWMPYLALERRNPEHNLLNYCDASHTHGWFLPLRDSLVLALQICEILQFAHDRNIVYRDHKILHYYWDPETHGVTIIDWNIAKRQPQGLSEAERQFDLVQFGARGLHHIFTGRPAQGSLPLGPNRPEEIEKASTHYPVNWTYDDERLPNPLRSILEMSLNQGYTQVRDIRQDLLNIYQQLPGTDKN